MERTSGCPTARKCRVACLFFDESQQPTCPQLRHNRRCTQVSPILTQSSQTPLSVVVILICFVCLQAFTTLPPRLESCRFCWPFQCFTVPLAEIRGGFIGALREFEKSVVGRSGLADVFVHQQKFLQGWMIEGRRRTHSLLRKSGRLRSCIGKKCCVLYLTAPRPESHTAHFVRIRFSGDGINLRSLRGPASGETSDRQIKTSPEEMHRTALADKA